MTSPRCSGRGRPARAIRTACLTLALALVATPARADSLSAGRAVTPLGTAICDYSLATSPTGGRVGLIYQAGTSCGGEAQRLFARLGRGRNLGPARALEDRGSASGAKQVTIFGTARIAVGANGGAVAAWVARGRQVGHDQLRVAIAPPGRRFGRAQTLSSARFRSGHAPDVKLIGVIAGPDGRTVVSWALNPRRSTDDASLRAAVRMPRERFGAPQKLGSIALPYYSEPVQVFALAPSGTVVAAWRPGEQRTATAATLRPGRRSFGATRKISGEDAAGQVRAVAGPGGAGVSWSDDPRVAGKKIRLRLARLRRDHTIGAAGTFTEVDSAGGALEVSGPQIAFARSGPFAAWQVFADISEAGDGRIGSTRIEAAPAGSPVPFAPRLLSAPDSLSGGPYVGALTDRVLIAWRERIAPDNWRLRLAVRLAGRVWRPTLTFAETDGAIQIAASRRSALVAWQTVQPQTELRQVRLAVYRP